MPDIMRLKDVANPILDDVFLASDQPSVLEPVVAAGDIELAAVEFDTQRLDVLLAHIQSKFAQFDTSMDAAMVVELPWASRFLASKQLTRKRETITPSQTGYFPCRASRMFMKPFSAGRSQTIVPQ